MPGRPDDWHNQLYETVRTGAGPFVCFYCGQAANTLDHCPPISRIDDYRALGLAREQFLRVPACGECNMLAADTIQPSLIEREMYVKQQLEQRYRKLLAMPVWTQTEIARLGRNLRSRIQRDICRKAVIVARIDYGAGINHYIHTLEIINPFEDLDNDAPQNSPAG